MLRFAEEKDIPEIYESIKFYVSEAEKGSNFIIDEEEALEEIKRDLQNTIIEEVDNIFAGFMVMEVHKVKYSKERFINEKIIYIKKEFRRLNLGFKFLKYLKSLADQGNMKAICGFSTGGDFVKKERFYTLAGYKPLGRSYIYIKKEE